MIGLLIGLAALGAGPGGSDDCWPGFLAGGSNSTTARDLPIHWSPEKGVTWEVRVPGYGQSSPVVWKDRVFVTAIEGDQKERCLIHAFDAKTGTKLWTREFEASQKKEYGFMVSRAAPTPAVDRDGLYVFFESGDIAMLSHDGHEKWKRSLVKDYGEFQSGHGIGSSLAQTDRALLVLAAHSGPSYLLAVAKATGETLWKADRESKVSWTSPIVAAVGGKSQVVVSSNGSVQGYDPGNGGLLWTLDGISGNTLPSASAAGDRILVGAGVSRRNPDESLASRSNCCLQLTGKGGSFGYSVAWSAEKATSSYATPLAHRGCAYFVNKVGVVYCLDLASGEQHYAKRIDGPCWASPLGAGDHVYFFTKRGVTTVLQAGPSFQKVASNRLWNESTPAASKSSEQVAVTTPKRESKRSSDAKSRERRSLRPGSEYLDPIVYSVAAVRTGLFIRTGEKLYCIRASASTIE